jgi:hypothetical protein
MQAKNIKEVSAADFKRLEKALRSFNDLAKDKTLEDRRLDAAKLDIVHAATRLVERSKTISSQAANSKRVRAAAPARTSGYVLRPIC